MTAFETADERRAAGTEDEGGRMPLVSSTGLFWSLRGAVLCAEHAAHVDRQAWLTERWEALPETSQGFHGARYQCQKCSPYGTALVHASDRHAADGRRE